MTEIQPTRQSLVYFVQAEIGGPIKIGIAFDPHERLRYLQNGSPFKLRITKKLGGGAERERALHQRFASARMHGEWFEATDALANVAGAIPASDGGRTAQEAAGYARGFDAGHDAAEDEVKRLEHQVEQLKLEVDLLSALVDERLCPVCFPDDGKPWDWDAPEEIAA